MKVQHPQLRVNFYKDVPNRSFSMHGQRLRSNLPHGIKIDPHKSFFLPEPVCQATVQAILSKFMRFVIAASLFECFEN